MIINIVESVGNIVIETDNETLNIATVVPSLIIYGKSKDFFGMIFELENIYNYLIDLKLDYNDKLKLEEVLFRYF